MKGRKKQTPAAPTEPADATPFFARFLESQEPEEDAEAKVSARARRAQATAKSRGGAKKSAGTKSAAKKSAGKKSAAAARAVTLKYPSDRDEWVFYPYQLEAATRGPGSGNQTLKYPSDGDEDTAFAVSYVDRKDAPTTARAKAKEARVTITKPRRATTPRRHPNMSERKAVLLVTHSGDHFTVERVAEALARRGARPVRFDTDMFPEEVRLSAALGPGGVENVLAAGGAEAAASEVRAVWARRVWPPRLSEGLDERFRAACARETFAALEGFFDGLRGARWVNDPARERAAENKLRQLRAAREAGLDIPPTLLTNDARRARDFYEAEGGRVVAKLLRPLSVSMGQTPFFVYTSDVRAEDVEAMDSLRHCPVVFQRKIEKRRELRVAYVAGRLFAGALDASASARGRTDWRLAEPGECSWSRATLKPRLATRLRSLMRGLGLAYGAIDLIETPEGGHVFLEVNPGGEWGMLEHDLGLPISDAIADALMSDK